MVGRGTATCGCAGVRVLAGRSHGQSRSVGLARSRGASRARREPRTRDQYFHRRSASSITGRTGTSTPGATCATTLRSFSVDGIRRIEIVDAPAKEVALKTLDDYLLDSYGIVRGGEAQRAKLRFSVERARWVASEVWHPDQKGSFDAEGRYLLELPFRDDRELVLDILRHGAEVEVLSPLVLRRKVIAQLAEAARLYK